MRKSRRMGRAGAVIKGFAAAAMATVAAMAVLTVIVWRTDMTDSTLVMINQLMKVCAVALGTYLAVGRGGEAGFLTGAAIGTAYMALGYAMYAALGGSVSMSSILGEWIVASAAGAFTGAVMANLPARKRA